MLYNVVVNEWGETTYVPTTLGNTLLAVLLVVFLVCAVAFAKKATSKADNAGSSRKLSAKQLAFCSLSIALGTVFSFIKLFDFPTGGSITLLSMLVICLPGYFFGTGAGLMSGIAYGILQLLIEPYIVHPAQLIIDYMLAFAALGLSGVFSNAKHGLVKGYVLGVIGRYIFAVLSGYIFFGAYAWDGWNPLPYSLVYNAIYIFSEAAATVVILLIPPVKKAMTQIKTMANQ